LVELRTGSGAVYAKYNYDSWGNLISVTNASGAAHSATHASQYNSIRYRGYVYDRETGLYYLQSRYYDPEMGRFLNADDVDYIGYSGEDASYNVFAYCENNAVNFCDPCGMMALSTLYAIIGIIVGVLLGGTAGGIISYKKYKSVSWKYIFIGAVAGAAICGIAGYAIGLAISASVTTATTAKTLSKTFKITNKISKQMAKRGWSKELIKSTISRNVGREAYNKATGNVATAYFTSSGAYVVIDNVTKEIIQISNINDPNWVVDKTIQLLKSDVFIK